MPATDTKYFGPLEYAEDSVLHFPAGLLGFEENKRFLLIERAASKPLSFLQSLDDPSLCFPVMPALQADPNFKLELDEQSRHLLDLHEPYPSLLILAVVSFGETEPPSANLKGPVAIHVAARRAVQVVQCNPNLALRHPVPAVNEVLSCW